MCKLSDQSTRVAKVISTQKGQGAMDLNEYQLLAQGTAVYPERGSNMVYPALGLVGEAGEVAEKVKKQWRNNGTMDGTRLDYDTKVKLVNEMGDVLWYLAALASELRMDLDTVAQLNLDKLHDRMGRGVIKSSGDSR